MYKPGNNDDVEEAESHVIKSSQWPTAVQLRDLTNSVLSRNAIDNGTSTNHREDDACFKY